MRSSARVRQREEEQEKAATAALDDLLASLEASMAEAPPRPSTTNTPENNNNNNNTSNKNKTTKNKNNKALVVFSGAGLSASTGMSTFSTPGGLYDRAKKRLKMPASGNGSILFHARCFAAREADVHAFLAELAHEALRAAPSSGHRALAELAAAGKVVRHYTLNVDGLAAAAGMPVWSGGGGGDGADDDEEEEARQQPDGTTVELHGSARRLVCRACGARADLTPALLRDMRAGRALPCPRARFAASAAVESSSHPPPCPMGSGRTGILLYDDPAAALITPAAPAWRQLERDLSRCCAVVWAGISFEQSASVGYFSRVVRGLREARVLRESEAAAAGAAAAGAAAGEAGEGNKKPSPLTPLPPQVIVNPSEDAMFNLLSGAGAGDLGDDVRLVELRMETDAALAALAARLLRGGGGGGGGAGDGDGDGKTD